MSGDSEDSQIATGQETEFCPTWKLSLPDGKGMALIFITSQLLNIINIVRSAQSQTGDSVLNL